MPCFNCEKSGHRAEACERPIMCSICLSEEHRERHCPFLLYSANVDVQPSSESYSSMKVGESTIFGRECGLGPSRASRAPPAHSTLGYWPSRKKSVFLTCTKRRGQSSPPRSHRDVQRSRIGRVVLFIAISSPQFCSPCGRPVICYFLQPCFEFP